MMAITHCSEVTLVGVSDWRHTTPVLRADVERELLGRNENIVYNGMLDILYIKNTLVPSGLVKIP